MNGVPSGVCVYVYVCVCVWMCVVGIQGRWQVKMLRWLLSCEFLPFICVCIFPSCCQASTLALPLGCSSSLLPWPGLPLPPHLHRFLLEAITVSCLLSSQSCRISPLVCRGRCLSHCGACLDCECHKLEEVTGLPG